MQGRYPRTVSEFAAHGRFVVVRCRHCNRSRNVPPDVLDAAFGPDFDIYDGYAGLQQELRCDQCGERGTIDVYDSTRRETMHGDVPFEEYLSYELERRALVRARGEESTATREVRRRRR